MANNDLEKPIENHTENSIKTPAEEEDKHLQEDDLIYSTSGIACCVGFLLAFLGWFQTDNECLIIDGDTTSVCAWLLFGYGISIISSAVFTLPTYFLIGSERTSGICNTGRRKITATILGSLVASSCAIVFMVPIVMSIFFFELPSCAYDQTSFIIVYGIITFVLNPITIMIVFIIITTVYECVVAKD